MVRMYFFALSLFLGNALFHAQNVPPCSDFNDPSNPYGNWTPAPAPNGNVSVGIGSPNALDGSPYLIIKDKSGGSWYQNSKDYRYLGEKFLGQCLSFDFYLENDSGYGMPYHPYIVLSDGTNSASFVANVTVTPGSGWVRVKAPIQLSSGGVLPSNSDGAWTMNPVNAAAFDNIIMNSQILSVSPDMTSTQQEVVYFDNFCITNCKEGCTADFQLSTSFSTNSSTATATLSVINPSMSSTPGNPGSSYKVDWGDGTSTFPYTLPSVSHNYGGPGSYTVCVIEMKEKTVICKKCFTFCYNGKEGKETVDNTGLSLEEIGRIAKTEAENANSYKEYSIAPNPAKNYVDILTNLSEKGSVSIRIIDASGKVMVNSSETVNSGRQSLRIATEKLVQGVYIVEIKTGNKMSSQKLMISK